MSLLRLTRAIVSRPVAAALRTQTVAAPVRSIGTAAPVTPGPDNWMTGRQLEEFDLELDGVGGFNDAPAEGAFGTMAAPVRIYSSFHSRIVGCKGGDHNQHRMFWFELKEGPKHVCTECGQVFQLVTPNSVGLKAPAAAAHHH